MPSSPVTCHVSTALPNEYQTTSISEIVAEALLNAIEEPVFLLDPQFRVQQINWPATQLLDETETPVAIGDCWLEWQAARLNAADSISLRAALGAGRAWQGSMVCRRRSGAFFHAALVVNPYREPGSLAPSFLALYRDVTALREAEHIKDRFLANISHELRNPVSVITLLSGNLQTLYGSLDDARRQQLIADLREQARLLKSQLDRLVQLGRSGGASPALGAQTINLATLVGDVCRGFETRRASRQATLVQSRIVPLSIRADQGQIRQVVSNLVENALIYTPPDGRVIVGCWPVEGAADHSSSAPPGKWAVIRVVDNGPGIDAAHMPHIFERFFRGTGQSAIPGLGVGLAIVRDLVTFHEGHITVKSIPGEGSVFTVYLPLDDSEATHDCE